MTYSILIVDDSKLARMAVAKALKSLHPDWARAEASNAAEALELIRQAPPDFVLLDFNMPGQDGVAFAGELRKLNPNISVAVVSANRQADVIRRAEAAGAAFLGKPVNEKTLGDFLNAALQRAGGHNE